MCVCVYFHVFMYVCVHIFVRVCVYVSVRVCMRSWQVFREARELAPAIIILDELVYVREFANARTAQTNRHTE